MSGLLTVGTFGHQELVKRAGGFVFTKASHPSGMVLGRHGHERASLVVVLGGGYHETFDGVSEVHGSGTAIVKPPGEFHSNDFTGTSSTCLLIETDEQAFDKVRSQSDIFDKPSCFSNAAATAIARHIVDELREPDALSGLQLESAALSLFVRCSRAARRDYFAESRRLERARELVHELPPGDATLSGIAAELDVHPIHLARAFKRAFGLSIGAYARRLQVERAIDLLLNSDRTVGEIAHAVGFYDQSHMARVLRRHTGMSASEIRRSRFG